jgi:hypothetical protein
MATPAAAPPIQRARPTREPPSAPVPARPATHYYQSAHSGPPPHGDAHSRGCGHPLWQRVPTYPCIDSSEHAGAGGSEPRAPARGPGLRQQTRASATCHRACSRCSDPHLAVSPGLRPVLGSAPRRVTGLAPGARTDPPDPLRGFCFHRSAGCENRPSGGCRGWYDSAGFSETTRAAGF